MVPLDGVNRELIDNFFSPNDEIVLTIDLADATAASSYV